MAKKVNPKNVFKASTMELVKTSLEQLEISVSDGEDYGMTKGTLVVHGKDFDMQLKPIVPKAGVDRYEVEEEEA